MAEMGRFCKAYLLSQLREFPGWQEKLASLRPSASAESRKTDSDGKLDDSEFFYLQENYIVTDGIFKDEHIVFDDVTEDWKQFCNSKLGFDKAQDE